MHRPLRAGHRRSLNAMLAPDITTDRFVLSCLKAADATETYRSWLLDPQVFQYLETRDSGLTADALQTYVETVAASSDSYQFGIFTAGRERHIGNIKLGPVSAVHSSASIGLMIGDRSWWGTGVATEVIAAVSRWAFDELGLVKLHAGAFAKNAGSTRAFEKCGYRVEGVLRSHVRLLDGSRDDVVLVGRLRDDPAES